MLTMLFARFMSRPKMIEIEMVVWTSAAAFTFLEAFFIFNPLHYRPGLAHVSFFRLIIVLLIMGFFWFGPLVLILSWNGTVFSFLLKVKHNGFVKKTPPQVTRFQTCMEYLADLKLD